ncbi:MAG: S-adenosylmethionine:tRNA ribosyltransferase-isomerase [Bacteroidaceae bacterium]|nr:S-adenosylmethionine:tRNA ribosyltransferase-isomerase [Bacteroidaceae bacterium]
MDTKHIQIRDYDYPLPDERIAKFPLPERDSSKLLIYDKGKIGETVFRSLPTLLPEGALMVFNNTRVIQARLHFRKGEAQDGALIEVFLLEPANPVEYQENFAQKGSCSWYCLVGNLKKWKEGKLTRTLNIEDSTLTITAERIGIHGTSQEIKFEWDASLTWAEVIDAVGELPIPPYLNRKTQESDKTTYQTVYSKIKGSVAAPTAGLHFTKQVLADIDAKGIEREEVTLHVGAGTFRPVKSEDIGGHEMHSEHIAVHRHTIERLLAHNGEAIAVGTTSVRTLESLYYMGILASQGKEDLHVPQWMPYEYDNSLSTTEALEALLHYMDEQDEEILHSSTQIIIAPGYKYHIVRRMITNFHQPQSTLLLLVSAFIGENWHNVYDYALSHDFRFLSYGDSSILMP